jgi:hypothetical protein
MNGAEELARKIKRYWHDAGNQAWNGSHGPVRYAMKRYSMRP